MAEKLKYRHRSDFEAELYKGKAPLYSIMPLADLKQNEVICQFGLGVYLPSETDQIGCHGQYYSGRTASDSAKALDFLR